MAKKKGENDGGKYEKDGEEIVETDKTTYEELYGVLSLKKVKL